MNLFLDTSCLVSFFLADSHSAKARPILENIARGEISGIISALSLVELCGTVRRIANEDIAREIITEITEMIERGMIRVLPMRNKDAFDAAELAISTALKGADAVIVNAASQSRSKLVTFDEEFKKKAKSGSRTATSLRAISSSSGVWRTMPRRAPRFSRRQKRIKPTAC